MLNLLSSLDPIPSVALLAKVIDSKISRDHTIKYLKLVEEMTLTNDLVNNEKLVSRLAQCRGRFMLLELFVADSVLTYRDKYKSTIDTYNLKTKLALYSNNSIEPQCSSVGDWLMTLCDIHFDRELRKSVDKTQLCDSIGINYSPQ